MSDDLREVLTILHGAGAEDVPSCRVGWKSYMMPAINIALNMGYMRYRERDGERYFSLTPFGYQKIGIAPFSAFTYLVSLIKKIVKLGS